MQLTTWFIRKVFFFTPLALRHRVRDLLPDEWVYKFQRRVNGREWERFVDASSKAKALEAKLWGGFSLNAKEDLTKLRDDTSRGINERSRAAWALARWYWVERNYEVVLANLRFIREALPERQLRQSFRLLEIDCLMMLGDVFSARQNAEEALQLRPGNVHYRLASANTYSPPPTGEYNEASDDERLRIINAVFTEAKLTPVSKEDAKKALALDNLVGMSLPLEKDDEKAETQDITVSIIMPVYKAADTISIALRSLLAQTWSNLQIIVVDDCSPDSTYEVAMGFAERDPRIRVLRQQHNQGAYAARNLGLRHAIGTFVTTHDSDDWSHPQKIELQVRDFLAHPQHKANLTYWVRALPHLYFKGTSRPSERLVQMNHSSLMMRRELLLELGGWDRVRITGDTELIWRLEHHPDGEKPVHLLPDVPLSFALEDLSSLTRSSRTHVRTMFYGVRREYREAIAHWHKRTTNHALPFIQKDSEMDADKNEQRLFPAPGFIHAKRTSYALDRLMLMDFNAPGPALQHALNILDTWEAEGLEVGVFQWRYYPLDVREPLNEEIRDRALDGKLKIIAPGENVAASITILASPPLAHYMLDLPPQVETQAIKLIAREEFCCLQNAEPESWDHALVTQQLERLFNAPVELFSQSKEVRT